MSYRYTTLIIAVVLALLGVHVAYAQPLDVDSYLRLLREAHAAAERHDRISLDHAAATLSAVERVTMPGGDSAPSDNRWLVAALDSSEPDMTAIAARLGALIDALSYPSGPPVADAEARLRAILAKPPFAGSESPHEPSWIDRFFAWLIDLLGRSFAPVEEIVSRGGSNLSWLIAIIGLVLVGIVLTVWLRGLRRILMPVAQLRNNDDPEAALSPDEAARQAGDLAHTGDYRRAARMLYLSALLWLDDQGRLRYDRALTNREYLERLETNPALRERLRPVVETFDRVWYGDVPLDARSFAVYRGQVESLREL